MHFIKPILLGLTLLSSASLASAQIASAPTNSAAKPLDRQNYHRHPGENQIGYARAVRVGNTLYVSGAVAAGANMAEQLEGVYQSLSSTLSHHGLTFQHVVKENVYATDIAALAEHHELRKKFYNGVYPAATWVEIRRLLRPQALVEVELMAVFP